MGLLKMVCTLFEHIQPQEGTFSVMALETSISYWPTQLCSYIQLDGIHTTNFKVNPLSHIKTKEERVRRSQFNSKCDFQKRLKLLQVQWAGFLRWFLLLRFAPPQPPTGPHPHLLHLLQET